MVDNLAVSKFRAAKAAESKHHMTKLKNLKLEHGRKYQKQVKVNEASLANLKQTFDAKFLNIQNDLKRKLITLQNAQKNAIHAENTRLSAELEDLKKAHGEQVTEIKAAQQSEREGISKDHQQSLKALEEKYLNDKIRYEVT